MNIAHTDNNLFDGEYDNGFYIDGSGNIVQNQWLKTSTNYIPILPQTTYAASATRVDYDANASSFFAFYDENRNFISTIFRRELTEIGTHVLTLVTPRNAVYMRVSVSISTVDTCIANYDTIPINWQSIAGIIYNGTVTLNEDGSADVVNSDTGDSYHLTDVANLTTNIGINTIWTDTNGTNTAEYWIKNT